MKTTNITALLIVAVAAIFLGSPDVWAGCGCDHPTPCPAPIMPAFASPGDPIKMTEMDFKVDDEGYKVEFKEGDAHHKTELKETLKIKFCDSIKKRFQTDFEDKAEHQLATVPGELKVNTCAGEFDKERDRTGPMDIKVKGHEDGDLDDKYEDLFVYLGRPLKLEQSQGHYIFVDFPIAVDSAGVAYIPLDLSNIQAGMNFAVYINNLPLDFETNDVLIYNKDAFNLNLFTLDVDGYEKQWGDWFGAEAVNNADPKKSDYITYWRHDFYEYHAAHQPGGSHYAHTENEDGHLVHPDGTVHVDHDRLVVAVSGLLRDKDQPENPDKMEQLEGGRILKAEIHILQLKTDDPQAFSHMTAEQVKDLSSNHKLGSPYTSEFFPITDPQVLSGEREMEICTE